MTLIGSCDKHNFITPQQQQANTHKANIHKANILKVSIHPVKGQTHIQETIKILDNQSKLNMYVSFVEIKAIMTTNVNLQQTLCKEHKRCFNALITHMRLIMIRNGPKERIMMITNSLFNKGGSWHR